MPLVIHGLSICLTFFPDAVLRGACLFIMRFTFEKNEENNLSTSFTSSMESQDDLDYEETYPVKNLKNHDIWGDLTFW